MNTAIIRPRSNLRLALRAMLKLLAIAALCVFGALFGTGVYVIYLLVSAP